MALALVRPGIQMALATLARWIVSSLCIWKDRHGEEDAHAISTGTKAPNSLEVVQGLFVNLRDNERCV
jgi:hypothetical protein